MGLWDAGRGADHGVGGGVFQFALIMAIGIERTRLLTSSFFSQCFLSGCFYFSMAFIFFSFSHWFSFLLFRSGTHSLQLFFGTLGKTQSQCQLQNAKGLPVHWSPLEYETN